MVLAEMEFESKFFLQGIEQENRSLKERPAESEPATAAKPPAAPPPVVSNLSMDGHDRMRGLAPLVRVLRDPESLFGASSERRPEACGKPVDWTVAPAEIRRYLTHWGMRCSDVLFHLKLAAEVLRENGISICRGDPLINFIWQEDTMSIQIVLCIDASSKKSHDLTCELSSRAIDFELPYRGFTFSFMDGEGEDDSEDEIDIRIRLARAKAQGSKG